MKKISLFKQTFLLPHVVAIPVITILSLQLVQANHFSPQDSTGNYTVSGKLTDYDSGWIYLRHGEGLKRGQQIDSTKIVHGEFTFNGKVSAIEPFMWGVHFKDNMLPSTQYQGPFILSPGKLYGEGKFESPNFWTFYVIVIIAVTWLSAKYQIHLLAAGATYLVYLRPHLRQAGR